MDERPNANPQELRAPSGQIPSNPATATPPASPLPPPPHTVTAPSPAIGALPGVASPLGCGGRSLSVGYTGFDADGCDVAFGRGGTFSEYRDRDRYNDTDGRSRNQLSSVPYLPPNLSCFKAPREAIASLLWDVVVNITEETR